MKTTVYSWRLPGELKSHLEREARLRNVPISSILNTAVRDWLRKSVGAPEDDDVQRERHAAAASCLGILAGGNSRRAETARDAIRKRLRRRRAR